MGVKMTAPITLGNLTVDRDRYEASIDGRRIDLTYVEFELLYALARNAGKALSRDRMMALVTTVLTPIGLKLAFARESRPLPLEEKLEVAWADAV